MKITEKDKKTLQILFGVVIVGLTAINIFYPQPLITDKFSLIALEQKKQEFDVLDGTITSNESMIKENQTQLENAETAKQSTELELQSLRNRINQEDLVFHMPSILISLEQNAIKNKVSLTIEYGLINSDGGMMSPQMSNFEDPQLSQGVIDQPLGGIATDTETTESVDDKMNTILNSYMPPQVNNVNVTVVPIKINGKYSDVRKFIRYLDTLEYMDPGYIDLESDGETVTGIIIINVFHGGGF